jgi:hypothetical protein
MNKSNAQNDHYEFNASIQLLRRRPMNCAVGDVGRLSEIRLHHAKLSTTLLWELMQAYPRISRPSCGIASISAESPREIRLSLVTQPASGICKRLARRLKGNGLRKVTLLVQGAMVENFERDDEEDTAELGPIPIEEFKARMAALGQAILDIPVTDPRGKEARLLLGLLANGLWKDPESIRFGLGRLEEFVAPQPERRCG